MSYKEPIEKEGCLDDFIDSLVSARPQEPRSIQLEIMTEEGNTENAFKILVEIFTKVMRYLYGDSNNVVNLDELEKEDFERVEQYFASFGYSLFVDKVTEEEIISASQIKDGDLRGHCLNIKTANSKYTVYFDQLPFN